jgi:hypothetical protein
MMENSNDFATGYAVGRDATNGGNNGCGNGMWGGDWLGYLLLFALIGGGGFGFGGFGGGGILPWLLFGNGNFGGGATNGYVLTSDFANIERKLDGINNGICDSTFALNNNINGNFRTLDGAICNIGYQALQNTNAIQTQLADCCCGIKGEIKDVAYANAMNTSALQSKIDSCCCDLEKANMQNRFDAQAYNCNTLQAIDKVGDRIIDYLANEKTQALRDENFALRLQASQAKQNEFLISRLGEKCPVPAFVVSAPTPVNFPTNCCGQVQFANGGCGCGCGSY